MILPEINAAGIFRPQNSKKGIMVSKERKVTSFEIELPINSGGISYIGDIMSPIGTDMIICAKPGQMRHTKFPFECYYMHIDIDDKGLCETVMGIPDFLKPITYDHYENIFSKILFYRNTGMRIDELKLQSLVLELIYSLVKDSERIQNQSTGKGSCYTAVEKAIKYINENLTEDLSLDVLAKEVSISPIYFHNCFKEVTGTTPRKYVENMRMKKAVGLLTTDLTLTQIAFECGFSSQSYFSYIFKQKFKKTPREYAAEIYGRYEI